MCARCCVRVCVRACVSECAFSSKVGKSELSFFTCVLQYKKDLARKEGESNGRKKEETKQITILKHIKTNNNDARARIIQKNEKEKNKREVTKFLQTTHYFLSIL